MNILKKRPLSLILCIMLGGFSLFAKFSNDTKLIVAAVLLSLLIANFVIEAKIQGRFKLFIPFLIALIASLLLSLLWSSIFFPSKYYDETITIEAKIYDIDTSSYNSKIVIKTSGIEGKKDRHKFLLYVDRDTAVKFKKYDVIQLTATLHDFSKSNDTFNSTNYYIGKGISAYLTDVEDIFVLSNSPDKLDQLLNNTALKLSNTLKKRSNYETGAFLSALIIGNRDDLDGNTRLNFSRAGISHILALSGMHLAILSAAISKILSLLGINKKYRTITISIFTLLYMALTGFSPSVVRAGTMLIITGLLYLLSHTNDSITSLFIAISVILVFTPYAVFDISLWLSAFATLGVIVFSEFRSNELTSNNETSRLKSMLCALRDGILVSAFAFAATFAISVSNFRTFSVISLFSTLIFAFIIELFIYLGIIALLIGRFVPMNKMLICFADVIKELAESISSIRWIYVSANSLIITIMLYIFSVLFFCFLLLDIQKKKRSIVILCALLCVIFAIAALNTTITRNKDDIIYSPDSGGDMFLLKSEGYITVVYSGKSGVNSSYALENLLTDNKITYLDTLLLTNYSYSSVQFCAEIMNSVKTDCILIPIPKTKDELNQAEGLADLLSGYGTKMHFYNDIDSVPIGNYSFKLLDKHPYSYGEKPMNAFKIYDSETSYLYISAGDYSALNVDAKMELYNCKDLFIGTGGNSNNKPFDMILPNIKTLNYGDEGRISKEVIDYYTNRGVELNYINGFESIKK